MNCYGLQVFELLDKDGDHTLDVDELFELLNNLDVCPNKSEISGVLKELDADGNGVIDFMEFLYAMAMSEKYLDQLESKLHNPSLHIRKLHLKPPSVIFHIKRDIFLVRQYFAVCSNFELCKSVISTIIKACASSF